MTDFAHLRPELREVANLSDQERIRFMDNPCWIGYPIANGIIETMRGLMEKPKRPRMPNILIVGESNNGKTTIIRRFEKLHGAGRVDEEADPVKPVIVAESPSTADAKGLYVSILERFWAPYRASDSTLKLRYQVVHQMRACQVRILIIDEFHSLLTGTAIKQREVMNAIKNLCNELSVPVVGVGTREAVQVLHTDPQHASRFECVALPLWQPDSSFQRLLASFEKTLPLRKVSNLASAQLARPIHTICMGNIGNLHQLLVECATEAIRSGREQIDLALVRSKSWLRPTEGIRNREVV